MARATSSTQTASPRKSGMWGVASPRTGPTMTADAAADDEEEDRRAERAARPDPHARGHEREAGGEGDQHRVKHLGELRHAEVELGLEGARADEQAAHQGDAPQLRPRRRARCSPPSAPGAHALAQEDGLGDQGQAGAADQHQVGRAPERHVLAEDAVPHVVEREGDQRVGAADRDQDAADRRVPVLRDPDRRGTGALALLGQRDREDAGGEDAEQADEDEVVGGVGQRAGVAAVVDVQGDVPVHPEQRGE